MPCLIGALLLILPPRAIMLSAEMGSAAAGTGDTGDEFPLGGIALFPRPGSPGDMSGWCHPGWGTRWLLPPKHETPASGLCAFPGLHRSIWGFLSSTWGILGCVLLETTRPALCWDVLSSSLAQNVRASRYESLELI